MNFQNLIIDWIKESLNLSEWPEDEWFALNNKLDLNLWLDGDTERAALYKIIDNQTITDKWCSLF